MPASTGGLATQVLNYSRKPVVTIGGSIGQGDVDGALSRQVFLTPITPTATGADNVLAVFSLPANLFDEEGRGILIRAMGRLATNINTKQIKLIFNPSTAVVGSTVGTGGTTIADTGGVAGSNVGWVAEGVVYKTGALGSNTQYGQGGLVQHGATLIAGGIPSAPAAIESGPILVAVTGNATTTATDIELKLFEVIGLN